MFERKVLSQKLQEKQFLSFFIRWKDGEKDRQIISVKPRLIVMTNICPKWVVVEW